MGIYDTDITSNPQTNVKIPPEGVGDYDPKIAANRLRKLANFGPKDDKPKDDKPKGNKKAKKEGVEGALDQVYAVQKPYSGCQLTSLVQPIDPLKGLEGSEVMPDQVHGVYPDQEMAQSTAEKLYQEHVQQETALEEKKQVVMEKIKKTMDELEKQRKESVEMIKENPKDAATHKDRVAHIATKIDHLVTQLQRIEASKKEIEPDKKKGKEKKEEKPEKKKVEEALRKALTAK